MLSANHLITNEDRIRETNDFLEKCPKFNHKMEAIKAPFKVVYNGTQKMYITPTNCEDFPYLGGLYLLTTPQLRYNWNHKPILVHFHVHNSLPPGPVLGQMNSVHMHSSYLCMTRLNTILQPTTWSFNTYLSLRFYKVFYTCCTFPMHSTSSTHVILPNLIILTLNDSDHEAPLDTVINKLLSHFFHSLVHIIS